MRGGQMASRRGMSIAVRRTAYFVSVRGDDIPPALRDRIRDESTFEGAKNLAINIERIWRTRGYYGIQTWVEDATSGNDIRDHWVVRSNMVNGYPPPNTEFSRAARNSAARLRAAA